MRVMPYIVCVALAGLLAGCLSDGSQTAVSQDETQVCEAKGGRVEVVGKAQLPTCILPLPDAGKSCETATDCEGFCLSETRQCSAVAPQFGCIPHLDETGRELVICID